MADTRADVTIPMRSWYNLYTAAGITPGTAVKVINKSSNLFYLAVKATAPTAPSNGNMPSVGFPVGVWPDILCFAQVDAGASGLWAWSPSGGNVLVQD